MNAKKIGEYVGIGICVIAAVAGVVWFIVWGIGAITPDAMTNDQIISETKKCKDADMKATHVTDVMYNTINVVCANKDEK